MNPSPPRWLEITAQGDLALARFLQPRISDEEVIDYIGRELLRVVKDEGCRRLVLNFDGVEALATHMLGELLVLHKKLQAAGGRLALCSFQPRLQEVFEVLKLTQVFHIYASEREAIDSFAA